MARAVVGVHLVKGDDPSLVSTRLAQVVAALVGDRDRNLVLDTAPDDATAEQIAGLVRALPFLADRRVVVVRDVSRFGAAEVAPLLRLLEDPTDTGFLVLEATGGTVPKKLVDAIKAKGEIHDASPGRLTRQDDRLQWVQEQATLAGVTLTTRAANAVANHVGEDVGRLPEILAVLVGVAGGRTLDTDEVANYLGTVGGVPSWELTGAIEEGNVRSALATLRRLLGADRHPFVVLATLTNHVHRVATLHGSSARDEREAADLLGIRGSTFPARKALAYSRSLSAAQVRSSLSWIAQADLDLRGMTENPPELVLEILVARLARLRPAAPSRRSAARP